MDGYLSSAEQSLLLLLHCTLSPHPCSTCAVGGIIKYGSLWLDAPFEADPRLALALVFAPPLSYAAYLLTRGQGQGQGGQ